MNFTVFRYDTIDSTNTEAAKQARAGAAEGVCVAARHQSAGRGRHGRTWVSDENAGLYFSVILRPRLEPRYLPLITLMTGVAVYDTLTEIGLSPDIKWVNDILVGERKISGILAETVDTPAGLAVVVGIGINVAGRNFSREIAETATSIEAENALSESPSRAIEKLESSLTRFLGYWYEILTNADGPAEIIANWRRRSSYYQGKPVTVRLATETIEGVTDGLEANGALRLKLPDDSVQVIQAGDVERLRARAETRV